MISHKQCFQNVILLITQSSAFHATVFLLIVFSAVIIGLETSPAIMAEYGDALNRIDRIIIMAFTLEMSLKILAHGRAPLNYFKDTWNLIDFFILIGCLVPAGSNAISVFRLIRILRVFRLITALPKLQTIVSALLSSIPSMAYVVILLGLHFYIYGVIGTFLFAKNDPMHFGSLGKSFLSLFQTLTLEGWVDLMRIQLYGCANFGYENYPGQCVASTPQSITSVVYFVTFIVMGTMIILNLLIGVVVNGMTESHKKITGSTTDEKNDPDLRTLTDEIKALKNEVTTLARFLSENSSGHPNSPVDAKNSIGLVKRGGDK